MHKEEDAEREKQPETAEAVADDSSTLKREHLGPRVPVEYLDLRLAAVLLVQCKHHHDHRINSAASAASLSSP